MDHLRRVARFVALSFLLSAGGAVLAQSQLQLPVTDTEHFDDLDAANQAPGTGGLPFGNGEFVALFNGNLHLTHPSSTVLPMDGGGVLSFNRSYNSANVRYYHALTASGWKDLLAGLTWVGLGWNAHYGRIFERSVWDPATSSYNDAMKEIFFEFPDGSLYKFSPETNLAQPNLDISFAWRCDNYETTCPKPTQPDLCRETCTIHTPYYEVKFPGGGGVHLERSVYFGKDGTWISKPWQAGYYATSVSDGKGNSIEIEYWNDANFPEAIKTITWSRYPDAKIETTLCSAADVGPDLPCVASGVGMLKTVTSIGFQGTRATPQKLVYRYHYGEVTLQDAGANVLVPVLTRVDIVGVDSSGSETSAGSIEYGYGSGLSVANPPATSAALLDRITYPLGAVSEFGYASWAAGRRRTGGVDNDRTTVSVTRRMLFPDGTADPPGEDIASRAHWGIERRFAFQTGVTGCDAGKTSADRWVTVTGPDALTSRTELAGHPCGIDDTAHDWGPYGAPEKVIALDGTGVNPVRTTSLQYDYARSGSSGRIVNPLIRLVENTFDDDDGTCFDGSASGPAQRMTTYFMQKDPYNFWKLAYSEGDYVRRVGGLPTRRVTYRNYKTPTGLGCPASTFSVGLFDYEFVEEGDQNYGQASASDQRAEVNYTVACNGLPSDIWIKNEFTSATTDPNQGTVTPNTATDSDDPRTSYVYDHGNVTQATRALGTSATGFVTTSTWDRGLRVSDDDTVLPVSRQADIGGRLSSTSDPNSQTTVFDFDSLGRPTLVDPPGSTEYPTRYVYPDLLHARVIQAAGSASDVDPADSTQQIGESEMNALGQVVKTWSVLPSGAKTVRVFRYDGMGRTVFESEDVTEADYLSAPKAKWFGWDSDGEPGSDWMIADVPTKDGRPWGTLYFYGSPDPSAPTNPLRVSTRDPLGRVARVEQADAKYATAEYCGPHVRSEVHDVRVSISNPQYATSRTTQYFDGYGHLVLVDAPAGSADAEYSYNVNGALTRVNLFRFTDGQGQPSDDFPPNAYDLWRTGQVPIGQVRTFEVDAAGRTTAVVNPEDGRKEFTRFDALGNVLEYRDAKALAENYSVVNSYDGAGRLTQVRRNPCTSSEGGSCNGFNRIDDCDGEFCTLGNWQKGFVTYSQSGGTFAADTAASWNVVSYGGCLPQPVGDQRGTGLYVGSNCSYAIDGTRSHAVRYLVTGIRRMDAFSMKYFRDVRGGTGGLDNFEVYVTPAADGSSVANRRYVLRLDQSQYSYRRWIETPPLRLSDLFTYEEWSAGQQRDFYIYIVFTKGDGETANLGTGVIVDDVKLGVRSTPIASFVYDTDVCNPPTVHSEACAEPSGATNLPRGRLTEAHSYTVDGRSSQWLEFLDGDRVVGEKRLVYKGLNGRLSAESTKIDWTGQGSAPEWVSTYRYAASGALDRFGAPHLAGVEGPRYYDYYSKRGFLDGIMDSSSTWIIEANAVDPAIEYDGGGRPASILFRSGAETRLTWDKMGRPASITAFAAGSAARWASGPIAYDGLGSVATIGSQEYAYDLSGRLVESRDAPQATNSPANALYKTTYAFDAFGNMTARDWSQLQGATQSPPLGYEFSGRTFGASDSANQNRVVTPTTFRYDPNGNAVRSAGTSPSEVASAFDAVNRLTAAFIGNPGATNVADRVGPAERYLYDAAGLRVAIQDYNREGAVTFTIRDAFGRLANEYLLRPNDSAPVLQRESIYGLGQQLAERKVVAVYPQFSSNAPMSTGTSYNVGVAGATSTESYAVDIRTDAGYINHLSGVVPSAAGWFQIAESALSPGASNYVRTRKEGGDAAAYSNPVVVFVDPSVSSQSENQVRAMSVTRIGNSVTARWNLLQDNGKQFKLYFKRGDTGTVLTLTPIPLSPAVRDLMLNDQSLGAPCGQLGVSQITSGGAESPTTYTDMPASGASQDLDANRPQCEPGSPPPSPTPPITYAFANEFHHRDHLGSLRLVTDAAGAADEAYDYYPYGRQMVPFGGDEVGSTRGRYTGHERDGYVGQDYMFARVKSTNEAMFATADTVVDASLGSPTSWHRYAYVRDNPLSYIDPFGTQVGEPTAVAPDGFVQDGFGLVYPTDAVDWKATLKANPWIQNDPGGYFEVIAVPITERRLDHWEYTQRKTWKYGAYATIVPVYKSVLIGYSYMPRYHAWTGVPKPGYVAPDRFAFLHDPEIPKRLNEWAFEYDSVACLITLGGAIGGGGVGAGVGPEGILPGAAAGYLATNMAIVSPLQLSNAVSVVSTALSIFQETERQGSFWKAIQTRNAVGGVSLSVLGIVIPNACANAVLAGGAVYLDRH